MGADDVKSPPDKRIRRIIRSRSAATRRGGSHGPVGADAQSARHHALAVMEQQQGGALTDEQAMELALEAQRWARQERRKS